MDATEWAVTYGGECVCGLQMALTGGGIPDDARPDTSKLDDSLTVECIGCEAEMTLPVVGITREPWRAQRDSEDDTSDEDGGS